MLTHNSKRDPTLNDAEFRLITIIDSYSKGCYLKVEEMAKMTGWSSIKVKRTIASLKKNGHIQVKYLWGKRMHIKVSEGSPMILPKVSPVIPRSITHDTKKYHQRYFQKEVIQEVIKRNTDFSKIEERDPKDFTNTPEHVSSLLRKAFPKLPKG